MCMSVGIINIGFLASTVHFAVCSYNAFVVVPPRKQDWVYLRKALNIQSQAEKTS